MQWRRSRQTQAPKTWNTLVETGEWETYVTTLADRLQQPRRDQDMVIVPSDQLYIEALPSEHPVLEDFKLRHREADLSKARAEVREQELDNLRRAAKLIVDETNDPDVDKHIVIEGQSGVTVVADPD